MLHKVTLPAITEQRLTEAMFWQFRLLYWAATTPIASRASCQEHLKRNPYLRQRANKIAEWVWRSQERYKPLQKFHDDASADPQTKISWVRQRRGEALRLLRNPQGSLKQINYHEQHIPKWQKEAASFWKHFYEDFRDDGLPECLFLNADCGNFTAQDFLNAFVKANEGLWVCPVCDVTPYFTIVQRKNQQSIYADIDHYLPKDKYPHLSIHPYNLVPLCHSCNSGVKGAKDPLASVNGGLYRLEEIWLPYRDPGLSSILFISIKEQGNAFAFDMFTAKNDHALKQQLDAVSDVLSRVYQLPGLWQDRIDQIGEKLFRRIRDYTRFFSADMSGPHVQEYLDELLYLLDQEDTAREPYAIPMIWWLAYLINAELSHKGSPLAQEIETWNKRQIKRSADMRAHGEKIRSYILQRPEVKNDKGDGPEHRQ